MKRPPPSSLSEALVIFTREYLADIPNYVDKLTALMAWTMGASISHKIHHEMERLPPEERSEAMAVAHYTLLSIHDHVEALVREIEQAQKAEAKRKERVN